MNTEFAEDVLLGFSHEKKYLPSKYLYDEHGSALYNQITRHPDYYLTLLDIQILDQNKQAISRLLEDSFNLIELGPGEGIKAKILMDQFIQDEKKFSYIAIDISKQYLEELETQIHLNMPDLKTKMLHTDFFQGIHWVKSQSNQNNVVLFLGSSIGNFTSQYSRTFFYHVWENLQKGDYFLIGFDLRKDIHMLMKAYDDADGLTRDFNLNLLTRMNRELQAEFNLDHFKHFATYDVYSGAMESYLVSMKQQEVYIGALNRSFSFRESEPIHLEYSYKYLRSQVEAFAVEGGFEVVQHFMDEKEYFLNSLWRVKK